MADDPWAHLRPARSDAAPIVHLIDLSDTDDVRVDADTDSSSERLAEFADLEEVYRRTYPSLVRTAYLLVDTREQAEEVVQDAFAKAFPKWSRLRTPDAYLRACVVNDAGACTADDDSSPACRSRPWTSATSTKATTSLISSARSPRRSARRS